MSSENAPTRRRTTDEIKTLLELPFRSAEINWRVLRDGEKTEGEARIVLYANRAAYVRRLDMLFGPGGWKQSFSMTTVGNIQRLKRVNKAYLMINTGKILVTSTITIEDFGSRASTGEGWADDENGTTRAQAQAFRRACAEFGLGRYLRELEAWNYKVPVNAKGHFNRPHISVLPDSAIHPSELAEARKVRFRTAKPSRKPPVPVVTIPAQGGGRPFVAASSQREPTSVTSDHASRFAPSSHASAQFAAFRTTEVKQHLSGYLEHLSKPLIISVLAGVSELHANGRMKGNLIDDAFFNLDRAVDLMNRINRMKPLLPSGDSLADILHSYAARTVSDLQTFQDLKAVSRDVTTIYQAEQKRRRGPMAA